jgi:hypothetical protein
MKLKTGYNGSHRQKDCPVWVEKNKKPNLLNKSVCQKIISPIVEDPPQEEGRVEDPDTSGN